MTEGRASRDKPNSAASRARCWHAHVQRRGDDWFGCHRTLRYVDEVICIDDGSSDASARIAEACGATVIRHRVNRGYSGALKTLFLQSLRIGRRRAGAPRFRWSTRNQRHTQVAPTNPRWRGRLRHRLSFVDGGGGTDMPAYRRLGIKVITAASTFPATSASRTRSPASSLFQNRPRTPEI